MKALVCVLMFLSAHHFSQAQRLCGTAEYTKQLLSANPSLQQQYAKIDKQIATALNAKNQQIANRDTSANELIYIPVVIHILYKSAGENISDDQVRSQLESLNNDYRNLNADTVNTPSAFKGLVADTRIQFCLARVDPLGKSTSGIDRKYTDNSFFLTDDAMKSTAQGGIDSWDSKHYLNIWICRLSGRALGYATPPGGPADKDGVVIAYDVFGARGNIRAPFNKGRTATHEIGHWLGLIHTWGDAACGDDHVDDTPAQSSYNFGCPSFPKLSACSPNGNGDMFMNFMDFTDDACMNMFTIGQAKRMRALFATKNIRNEFLNSFACDSSVVQGGPLPVDTSVVIATPVASVKIYPNPVHTAIMVEYKAASQTTTKNITIYNAIGVRVFTTAITKEISSFDLSKYAAGIYIVKVNDGKNTSVTKIIKE